MKIEGFKWLLKTVYLLLIIGFIECNVEIDTSTDNLGDNWNCIPHAINNTNSSEEHPEHPYNPRCASHRDKHGKLHLKCIDGIEEKWLRSNHNRVHILTLISWPNETFPIGCVLHHFPLLENFRIYNSSFYAFDEDFPATARHLKNITLSGLNNLTMEISLLSQLTALEELDLRNNRLTTIHPDFISTVPNLMKVFLMDNRWNCSDLNLQWLSLINTTSRIIAKSRMIDYYNLTCQGSMYPGKPLHVVMDLIKMLREECPNECACSLVNLVRDPNGILVPITKVDCSSRGLVVMPPNIPNITTFLLLNGNRISEVHPLAQNMQYRKVVEVNLDNNFLTNVDPLEGADWMQTFRMLSLRGNNISQIPTYAFEHAFEANRNLLHVYLGNNPWHCSCHFTPGFQELILKFRTIIADIPDIKCAEATQPEISKVQITTLARTTICRETIEYFHPVDIVNIFLASLIFLVITKFGYDYYHFKKTGQLPWIASKIP